MFKNKKTIFYYMAILLFSSIQINAQSSWQYIKKLGSNIAYPPVGSNLQESFTLNQKIIDQQQNFYLLYWMTGDSVFYDKTTYKKEVVGGVSFLALMKVRCDGSLAWCKTIAGTDGGEEHPSLSDGMTRLFFGKNENEIYVSIVQWDRFYYVDKDSILPLRMTQGGNNTCTIRLDSLGNINKIIAKDKDSGYCLANGFFPTTQNFYAMTFFDSTSLPRVGNYNPQADNVHYKGKSLIGNYFLLLDSNFNYVKITQISKGIDILKDSVSSLPIGLDGTSYLIKSLGVVGNKAYYLISDIVMNPLSPYANSYDKRRLFLAHNDSLKCLPKFSWYMNFNAFMVYDDSANHVMTKFGYSTNTKPGFLAGTCGDYINVENMHLGKDNRFYFTRSSFRNNYQWDGDTIYFNMDTLGAPSKDTSSINYGAIDTNGKLLWYRNLPTFDGGGQNHRITLSPNNDIIVVDYIIGARSYIDINKNIACSSDGWIVNGIHYSNCTYQAPVNALNYKPILIKLKPTGEELIFVGDDRRRELSGLYYIHCNSLGNIFLFGGKTKSGSVLNEDSVNFEIPGIGSDRYGELFIAKYGTSKCQCDTMLPSFLITDSLSYGKISVKYTGTNADSVIYFWGDGSQLISKPAGQIQTKIYNRDSSYTIRCVVYNNCSQLFSYEKKVKVRCDTIRSSFAISQIIGKTIEVQYNGDLTDSVIYLWGDGNESKISSPITQKISHNYSIGLDTVVIRAIVVNHCGKKDTFTKGYRFCVPTSRYQSISFCNTAYRLNKLSDTNYTFVRWSDGQTALSRLIDTSQKMTGIYIINKTGCEFRDSLDFKKFNSPIKLGGTSVLNCMKTPITLNSPQPDITSYLWNTGATTSTIKVNTKGIYVVKKTHPCGLYLDTFRVLDTLSFIYDTFRIKVCEPYTWRDSTYRVTGKYTRVVKSNISCDSILTLDLIVGQFVYDTFKKQVCESFTWRDSTYKATGKYTRRIKSNVSCDSMLTLDLMIGLNPKVRIDSGIHYQVDGDYVSYQWYLCNPWRKITNETKKTFTTYTKNNYAVVVSNGVCMDTSNCVSSNSTILQIESSEGVRIYPNPSFDMIYIDGYGHSGESTKFIVHNLLGQEIYRENDIKKDKLEIDIRKWPIGIYLIEIRNNRLNKTYKIIKE